MKLSRRLAIGVVSALCIGGLPLSAQEPSEAMEQSLPLGHIALDNPAELSREDAEKTYLDIIGDMAEGYDMAEVAGGGSYRRWQRFNAAPYRSAQHGERFVNNYGNTAAADYALFEDGGPLPEGAILAKDSFTVTADGQVYAGALFLMEKMAPGFLPEARDWRYTMILPDGSLFGTTGGEGSDHVAFCIDCHQAAGDAQDHLFFIPESFRM